MKNNKLKQCRYLSMLLLFCIAITSCQTVSSIKQNARKNIKISNLKSYSLDAPKGEKNWFWHGLVLKNDSTFFLRDKYSIRFEIRNFSQVPFDGTVELVTAKGQERADLLFSTKANYVAKPSNEFTTIDIPLSSFDYAVGENKFLEYIASVVFTGKFADDKTGDVEIKNIQFIEAPVIKIDADIRSKAANNGIAEYDFKIKNTTTATQTFRLKILRDGWEGMSAKLSKDIVSLNAGESIDMKLFVNVPAKLPAGAHEKQIIQITPQNPNLASEKIEFITAQLVPSPFLILTNQGWEEVKEKIKKYDWAKKRFEDAKKNADSWKVPEKSGVKSDQGTMGVVKTRYEDKMHDCIVVYQLTKEEKYFKKLYDFLMMFSNVVDGYPVLLHATSQGIPQEGGTFELVARSYDVIKDRLTPAEQAQVEHTMRLYIDTILGRMNDGGITNWTIFNQVPAIACALVLHDMTRFNKLMYEPTGLIEQFRQGTMNDGWWFEMSLSYNLHCADGFTKVALMAKNFGIDLLNLEIPASLSDLSGRRPYELSDHLGMKFTKFGPIRRNAMGIKAMWDGILAYPDYRGVMFGMGDGHEQVVNDYYFDVAYYAFRDPKYLSLIANSKKRDLVYGIGELPENLQPTYKDSVYSENAGLAVLRSQKGEDRERIQTGLKYGTHGGYHGHFDRMSLLYLMRYGRGFWNPESTWYGYPSYMYKWWVQTSIPHNMVIVDGKMQEPTESEQVLFHTGQNLQVSAVQGTPRWSNPPYLGGYQQIEGIKNGTQRYVPIPEKRPEVGEVTDYTEGVFQRRMQVVADDYLIIFDYLKGENEHVFDNMLHLRGAKILENLKPTGHRAQYDESPLSSGQFVVNVDEFDLDAPAKITSIHKFNEQDPKSGRNKRANLELTDDFYHEAGNLLIDGYLVYPAKAEFLLADYPENQAVSKRLNYEIKGDGKVLNSGVFMAWILGKGDIDVDISGVKELELVTTKDYQSRNGADTLFWANAVIVDKDGKVIPLSSLVSETSNLKKLPESGKDYYGGSIRIAGDSYSDVLAAEPVKEKVAGSIKFDLSKINGARLKAVVGGDFPAGQDENLRKVTSVRSKGKTAEFVTVLEPYEKQAKVQSARAIDKNTIEVKLIDGTIDIIKIKDFYTDQATPKVEMYRNGKLLEVTK